MKFRHKLFYKLLRPLVIIYLKIKFRYKFKVRKDLPENYIVLSNHATDYDPVFLGVAFRRQMYFVASEHITRFGKAYSFLKYVFDPIVKYKGTIGARTVIDIMKKTKKGGNVCLFAEGARTWDGVTADIHPSTAKLVKSAGCGLVTFRLSGGYFTSPMWSNSKNTRRGKMFGEVKRIFTKEEIAAMSEDEIFEVIKTDLYENAYETQRERMIKYKGKNLAENMEKLLFKCPDCSSYDSFRSEKTEVKCERCNHLFTYNEYGMLEGAAFDNLLDFSNWQKEEVIKDVESGMEYRSESAEVYKVENHESNLVLSGVLTMNGDKMTVSEKEFVLSDIMELSMHGNSCLCFTYEGIYYEIKVQNNRCAVKYIYYFNHARALSKKAAAIT